MVPNLTIVCEEFYDTLLDKALTPIKPDITVVSDGRKYVFEVKRTSKWSSLDRSPERIERYNEMPNFRRGYVVVIDDYSSSNDDEEEDKLDQVRKKAQRADVDLSKWQVWVLAEDDAIWETDRPRASDENEGSELG
jgi:hypothetical protein